MTQKSIKLFSALACLVFFALIGCGGNGEGGSGGAGTGGVTTGVTSTGGSGGTTTSSTGTGEPACVEPTPAGYPDPLAGWAGAVANFNALGTAPDESNQGNGSAAVAVKFGPFACPHDFSAVAVDFYEDGIHAPPEVARVAILSEAGQLPTAPPFPAVPTVIPRGECPTSGAGACPSIAIGDVPFVVVPLVFHAEPGDVIWPSIEMLDGNMGIAVSAKAAPDLSRAAYYAPPGSVAGGQDGAWALLSKPPPGVPVLKFAPVMRLIEGGAK